MSSSLYESVFNSSPLANYLLSPTPEAIVLAVNDVFLETASRKREDLVGRSLFDAFPGNPDDPEDTGVAALRDSIVRVIATGKPHALPVQRYPIKVTASDGEERYEERFWNAVNTPIFDEDGRLICISHTTTDVTKQRHAEIALRKSEERFRSLVTATSQVVWVTDPKGNMTDWSSWVAFTGQTTYECRDDGWLNVVHPDDREPILSAWKAALASAGIYETQCRIRRVDGEWRWVATRGVPVVGADGSVREWVGTTTDITEHKRVEELVLESAERLRLAADAAKLGIWSWDVKGDRGHWENDRMYEIFGLSKTEEGLSVAKFLEDFIHAEDSERFQQAFARTLETGVRLYFEGRFHRPSNREVHWFELTGLLHNGKDGKPSRVVGTAADITERKRAEEALRQADRRKDEFLAMLAHELRNPLAPISTAAQMLKSAGADDKRIKKSSEVIARQVRHMTELIDDLLDVSRVTRGLVVLEKERLDIKSVVASAIEQARPLIEARGHMLNTRMQAADACVCADRTRLIQVIVNLLTNAAKYTPRGGEIMLTLEVRAAEVVVSVADNGIGIEPSLLPHVFELFTQAERTPDRSQGGLGLGLALVRSIMTMHGGRVEAKSDGPGKGSTFSVALPTERNVLAQKHEASEEKVARQVNKPLRLMVVDDNLDAAQSLAALLELDGHKVIVKSDSRSALQAAAEDPPEVFILDIGLPEMNGYELAKRLRARPETANASFIALTGYGQAHDKVLARAAGFDHHFVKPMDTGQLARILARRH